MIACEAGEWVAHLLLQEWLEKREASGQAEQVSHLGELHRSRCILLGCWSGGSRRATSGGTGQALVATTRAAFARGPFCARFDLSCADGRTSSAEDHTHGKQQYQHRV